MGMFDDVHFEMDCPKCGAHLNSFQSKSGHCELDTVEPDGLGNFYSSCRCGAWIEFSREQPKPVKLRDKPLTRDEVEALGFVMKVTTANLK